MKEYFSKRKTGDGEQKIFLTANLQKTRVSSPVFQQILKKKQKNITKFAKKFILGIVIGLFFCYT